MGLRVNKTDSSGVFNYVTDGTDVASPVLKDGAATYTPGLSERRGTTSKFLHGDHLGSTRGITDSSQTVTDAILYDGFDMVVTRTGTTPTPFGFVGGSQYQTDADSGLMLLGHRYYDAGTGRFISQDPIHDGTNWYAYCENNPLTRSDSKGLDWLDDAANFFAGWGDTLSGGATGWVRGQLGVDDVVDRNSGWYRGGEVVGTVHDLAMGMGRGSGRGIGRILPGGSGRGSGTMPPGNNFGRPRRGGGNCFVAGTLVQMADGTTKPIEEVKVGDYVQSRDQYTHPDDAKSQKSTSVKQSEARKVVHTFVTKDRPILKVTFENGEVVETTDGHPFFVEGKGWILAGQLGIGNSIVTRAGHAIRVKSLYRTGKRATVYNFEVEGMHTYYVGISDGGLWVHNASRPGGSLPSKGGPKNGTLSEDRGNGNGTIRDYDNQGRPKVDYDFGHDHGAGDPHAHDWDWTKDRSRGRGRPLKIGE